MKTLNKLFFAILSLSSISLCSCSDSEEPLTPSPADPNYFAVDDADTSEEGKLRRDFYNNTGIYLLFNDTIHQGYDSYGVYQVETVDFNWESLTGNGSYTYRITYIDEIETKKSLVDMLGKYFIPYINVDGGQFKPYSLLLSTKMELYNSYSRKWSSTATMSTWRCFAIACENWFGLDETEARIQGKDLLNTLISTKLTDTTPALADFFAVSGEDIYYSAPADEFPDWEDEQDIELIYEAGFLKYYPDSWGDPYWDMFPTTKNDLLHFQEAVLYEDPAEFKEKWADYPKIIQKFDILREVIENLGVNLNAVE